VSVLRWAIFLSLVAFAYFARIVLIPIFLSVFLAMLFEPVVEVLVNRRVHRKPAATIVVLSFVVVSAAALWFVYLSSFSLLNDLAVSPRVAALASYVQRTAGSFDIRSFMPVQGGHVQVQKVEIVQEVPAWMGFVLTGFGSIFGLMSVGIFVPLLLFYFLFDKENLVESLNAVLGEWCYLPTLNSELPNMIRAFFYSNIVTGGGLMLTHAFLFYALNFENWVPLAVITGFLNMLPIVGAPLAILVPIVMGILPAGVVFPYLGVIVVSLALHLVFNNFVLPVLIGSRININTASLAIGLLFWSWLWGGIGFLIAIPMTALIKIFLESNSSTVPIANLMAGKPQLVLNESEAGLDQIVTTDVPKSV
jgi:predicted PurR-regulated permease PerM